MRIKTLDNAKLLTCLLVIFAHLYSTYSYQRLFIYAFHMPLFFIISGALHNTNGSIQFHKHVKKVLKPIIIYFVLFSLLYIPLVYSGFLDDSFLDITRGFNTFIKQYAYHNIKSLILGIDGSNVVLWFLFALFYCKLLLDIKYKVCRNTISKVIFWSIVFIILIIRPSFFYIGQGFMAFPFYFLGHKLKPYLTKIENDKHSMWILPLMIVSVLLTCYNGRVSMSGISYGIHNIGISIPIFYINALIGSLSIILFSALIPSLNKSDIANSLITILGLQMIFVLVYRQLLGTDTNIPIAIIASIAIFIVCYLIHETLYSKIWNTMQTKIKNSISIIFCLSKGIIQKLGSNSPPPVK